MPITPSTPPLPDEARRECLRQAFGRVGGLGVLTLGWPLLAQARTAHASFSRIGPLGPPDANGICLPPGLRSRVVAVAGEIPVLGSTYAWHTYPDGGATFATPDGGWIYANNSEIAQGRGGVGALRFDAHGRVIQAYPILTGTTMNCAGGATPWGTWLSAEEYEDGRVWECFPTGRPENARVCPALGLFRHEAVAVDPMRKTLYLTEDEPTGRLYRFVCSPHDWPRSAARPALRSGVLQVLQFKGLPPGQHPDAADLELAHEQAVVWVDVIQPDQAQARVRAQLAEAAPGTPFRGGEGLWYHRGIVYFSTKGDNRIWAHDVARQTLQTVYDFAKAAPQDRVLSGVDNLTVSHHGDVLVAEDGGNMELCVIRPDKSVRVLLRIEGQDGSEITGPAFSPDGQRLYFNSQRGGRQGPGLGITYEVRLSSAA